jgi:hypothetical protein
MLVSRLLSQHSACAVARPVCATFARRTLLALLVYSFALTGLAAASPEHLKLTFRELAASPLIAPAANGDREAWLQLLSPSIRAAEGKTVEITGYMLPLKIEGGQTREFLLMRDQSSCCFGKPPAVTEYVVVSTAASSPGVPATMDIPRTIRATLRIEPGSFGGELSQFYTLQNAHLVTR